MSEEVVLQIVMDTDLKSKAEKLYESLGISFSEAIKIFAQKSLEKNSMPFSADIEFKKK